MSSARRRLFIFAVPVFTVRLIIGDIVVFPLFIVRFPPGGITYSPACNLAIVSCSTYPPVWYDFNPPHTPPIALDIALEADDTALVAADATDEAALDAADTALDIAADAADAIELTADDTADTALEAADTTELTADVEDDAEDTAADAADTTLDTALVAAEIAPDTPPDVVADTPPVSPPPPLPVPPQIPNIFFTQSGIIPHQLILPNGFDIVGQVMDQV